MSTSVTFHLIPESVNQRVMLAVCRIIEKYYQQEKSIFIHAPSLEEAEKLDSLLWTYQDVSFLPHRLYDAKAQQQPPIAIGHTEPHTQVFATLVNLASEVPAYYAKFEEVLEIVPESNNARAQARERFKQYRNAGCKLATQDLTEG